MLARNKSTPKLTMSIDDVGIFLPLFAATDVATAACNFVCVHVRCWTTEKNWISSKVLISFVRICSHKYVYAYGINLVIVHSIFFRSFVSVFVCTPLSLSLSLRTNRMLNSRTHMILTHTRQIENIIEIVK